MPNPPCRKADVFAAADGVRTVRQLADALGMKDKSVAQILRRADSRHLAPKTNHGAGMGQRGRRAALDRSPGPDLQ